MLEHEPIRWPEPLLAGTRIGRLLVVAAAIVTAVALLGAAGGALGSMAAWPFGELGAPDLASRALALSL